MTTTAAPDTRSKIDVGHQRTRSGIVFTGPADEPRGPFGRRRARHPATWCVVAYIVLSILAFYPIGPFDANHLPIAGGGNPAGNDPYQMTWFLAYVPYAITHGLSLFHTNFIDYPTGVNLADNTSVPLLGILGWPVTATLGPVATFNFLIRLAIASSGISMFFCLRRWTRTWQAAFVGGLLYAFSPYMAAQELHIDLTFVPIPPLLVLCADEFLRRQKWSPWRLGLIVGLLATVQYLTSPDVISGCIAVGGILGVGMAVKFRKLIRSRLVYMSKTAAVAAGSFLLLSAFPIYEMLVGPGRINGPVVPVSLLQSARADLLGAVVPSSNQLATPPFLSFLGDYFVGGNLSENGTYIGIPLLIVLFVVVRRLRKDPTVAVMACAAVTAWVLSLGGHLVIGTWNSHLPLPGDLLAQLPLFDNTIPARYALYVMLFASMVLAIGLDRIWFRGPFFDALVAGVPHAPRVPTPRAMADFFKSWLSAQLTCLRALTKRQWKLVAFVAIVIVSVLPNAPFASGETPWSATLPSTIESVVPSGTVVLTVPFPTPSSSEAMTWQALDHMDFRIVGGYANIADPGKKYGERQPLPLPPLHVQEILSLPKLGSLLPWVTPAVAEEQLLTYLDRYSIGAVVFSAMGAETSLGYWYLMDTLGQPGIVRPGYAIWLPTDGHWPTRPVGRPSGRRRRRSIRRTARRASSPRARQSGVAFCAATKTDSPSRRLSRYQPPSSDLRISSPASSS